MTDTANNDSPPKRSLPFLRILSMALILAAAWLLWSGFFKPLLLSLGLVSVLLTLYILQRMQYFDNDSFAFRYNPIRLMGFWLWIGKEIVVSSLAVTKVIFQRNIEVNPQLIELDVTGFDSLDQALYGNSITLTPGTLALDVHDDRILVHSMLPEAAADLEAGEMQRRVARLRKR